MSNERKTPKRMDSRTRKAMLYCLAFFSTEKPQDSKTQIGVKNEESKIISKLRPSIPKASFALEKDSQVSS